MITSMEDLNKNVKRRKTSSVIVCSKEKSEKQIVLERLEFQKSFLAIMFLPPKHPFPSEGPLLSPISAANKGRKTLVLDLDETLVHCSTDPDEVPFARPSFHVNFRGNVHEVFIGRRPHLQRFLEQVSQWYEVVLFTASQSEYAESLLDILDPQKHFFSYVFFEILFFLTFPRHRLFREACSLVDGNYVKDLDCLGRSMENTIIIDNSPLSFGYHLNNGIPISSWFYEEDDNELLNMLPFLHALSQADDVRPVLKGRYGLSAHILSMMKVP